MATTTKDQFRHRTVEWSGAHAWRRVMRLARRRRVLALDLPGVGASTGAVAHGARQEVAAAVHDVVTTLGLRAPTLVGHDIGGMVVFSYLRTHGNTLSSAVIMDTVIPGVAPWDQVRANPQIWHFAFHAVTDLPERPVDGRQRPYFDYFYDTLSPDPTTVTDAARTAYAAAYRTSGALTAGFDWYGSFDRDAADNAQRSTVDAPDQVWTAIAGQPPVLRRR